jgi:hypothetical protein
MADFKKVLAEETAAAEAAAAERRAFLDGARKRQWARDLRVVHGRWLLPVLEAQSFQCWDCRAPFSDREGYRPMGLLEASGVHVVCAACDLPVGWHSPATRILEPLTDLKEPEAPEVPSTRKRLWDAQSPEKKAARLAAMQSARARSRRVP